MAKLDQKELEAHICNGTAHTYPSLCASLASDETQRMQIDRTIQKLRRAKKIKLKRKGRTCFWQVVPPTPKPTTDAKPGESQAEPAAS